MQIQTFLIDNFEPNWSAFAFISSSYCLIRNVGASNFFIHAGAQVAHRRLDDLALHRYCGKRYVSRMSIRIRGTLLP